MISKARVYFAKEVKMRFTCLVLSLFVAGGALAQQRGRIDVTFQPSKVQYQSPDASMTRSNVTTGANPTCTNSPGGQCDEPRSFGYINNDLAAWPWYETLNSFIWSLPAAATQYTFVAGTPVSTPFLSGNAGYPGGTLAVTYNTSESNYVVWAVATAPGGGTPDCNNMNNRCPGFLLAYKMTASTGALSQIWPDPSVKISGGSGSLFYVAPMATPTVVNGKAYVPSYKLADGSGGYTNNGVEVYACASGTGCH